MLQQSNPADSPGSPRASALLPSRLVWTGQGMKPQPPAPPPCSRGFIDEDQTTESLSVELAPRDRDFIYSPEPFPELSL